MFILCRGVFVINSLLWFGITYYLNYSMMLKRKRDPTFTTPEKKVLLALVEKHFSVIGCSKNDAHNARNKITVWRKIATEFNTLSPIIRDSTVLRNCWENLKKRIKQDQATLNQHNVGTDPGEVPPQRETTDPITTMVLKLIRARETGSVNTLDSEIENEISSEMFRPRNRKRVASNRKIHLQNRTQEIRQSILNSSLKFKKRQLKMMEEEHQCNIKIAKLTLKKLALEISLLENKKSAATEE